MVKYGKYATKNFKRELELLYFEQLLKNMQTFMSLTLISGLPCGMFKFTIMLVVMYEENMIYSYLYTIHDTTRHIEF